MAEPVPVGICARCMKRLKREKYPLERATEAVMAESAVMECCSCKWALKDALTVAAATIPVRFYLAPDEEPNG